MPRKALGADWQGVSSTWSSAACVSLVGKALARPPAQTKRAMLQQLSGTRHSVITAQCCYLPALNGEAAQEAVALSMAHITMMPLMPDQIEAYVASGEGIGGRGLRHSRRGRPIYRRRRGRARYGDWPAVAVRRLSAKSDQPEELA